MLTAFQLGLIIGSLGQDVVDAFWQNPSPFKRGQGSNSQLQYGVLDYAVLIGDEELD